MSQTRFLWQLTIFFTIIALFTAASFYFSPTDSQDVLTAAVVSDLSTDDTSQTQPLVFFVNEDGLVEDVGILFSDGSIER